MVVFFCIYKMIEYSSLAIIIALLYTDRDRLSIYRPDMKIVYIDAQNVHKAIQELWRTIDRESLYHYLQRKFEIDRVNIFFGYIAKYDHLYKKLGTIGYTVIHKQTMILPDNTIKWNVDIDIAIKALIDFFEWNLTCAYLISSDGDYNTLVDFFRDKQILGRVLIPTRKSASKLLKQAAQSDIQSLEDLHYFLQKKSQA